MISIIVPVYNVERCLPQCLDSLLGQTYRDIEVICVNDGSPDNSAAILAEYAGRDNRLKVITQENAGIASARNKGIQHAKGDWIMFVDSDDWVDITTCETAMEAITNSSVDVVFWAYVREFVNGKSVPRLLMNNDMLFDGDNARKLHRLILGPLDEELSDPTLIHSWGTVWGKLYSRKAIGDTQFVDTKIVGSAEDVLFNIEVFNKVKKAYYVNKPMYHYRKNGSSFTGGYNKNLNERWVKLYAAIADIITCHHLPPDFNKALHSRISLGLIGQGINECESPRNSRDKIKMIRRIITSEQYRLAVADLPLKYFPVHWRLFFWSAKKNKAIILYMLLLVISNRDK